MKEENEDKLQLKLKTWYKERDRQTYFLIERIDISTLEVLENCGNKRLINRTLFEQDLESGQLVVSAKIPLLQTLKG